MEALALLGLILATVGLRAWVNRSSEAHESPWHELAKAVGLTDMRRIRGLTGGLSGRLGSLEAIFEANNQGEHHGATHLEVRGLARFVAFKREGLGARFEKVVLGGEIEIGDSAFDRTLYLQGDERFFRALLDAETRARLLEAFSGSIPADSREPVTVQIADGSMKVWLGQHSVPSVGSVRRLLDLAARLQEPADLLTRLAENAERDPLPSVRLGALRTLERIALANPATRAAMERAARTDAAPRVRLHAGVWLGREGWPTLLELAADGAIEDDLSAGAIEALGEHLPLDQASRALEQSLAASRSLTARAAVKALGRGGEAQVAVIASAVDRMPDIAAAAASALGQTGSVSAEVPLLTLLRGGTPESRMAAAEAVGHVGTAASVLTLKELAMASGGRLRSVALESIARIRSRLTGADPGQLSMAAGSEGDLALADEQGRVTVPDPQDPS